jgi:hypothetical protein
LTLSRTRTSGSPRTTRFVHREAWEAGPLAEDRKQLAEWILGYRWDAILAE